MLKMLKINAYFILIQYIKELTSAAFFCSSDPRWFSIVIITGYSDVKKAFSFIANKQSLKEIALVNVLQKQDSIEKINCTKSLARVCRQSY